MRLVCPYCGSDEQLYSIETAALMYPVRTEDGEFYHTGGDYVVADDTVFEGNIYCRGDDEDLRPNELMQAANCVGCGLTVFRKQTASRARITDRADAWRDAGGISDCPSGLEKHQVGA